MVAGTVRRVRVRILPGRTAKAGVADKTAGAPVISENAAGGYVGRRQEQ